MLFLEFLFYFSSFPLEFPGFELILDENNVEEDDTVNMEDETLAADHDRGCTGAEEGGAILASAKTSTVHPTTSQTCDNTGQSLNLRHQFHDQVLLSYAQLQRFYFFKFYSS